MKCPYCDKEIEDDKYKSLGTILANLIFFSLPLMFIFKFIPLNIEDGYSANYGMLIMLILMVVYGTYAFLSSYNILKGKFLITNLLRRKE